MYVRIITNVCLLFFVVAWPHQAEAQRWLFVSLKQDRAVVTFSRDEATGELTRIRQQFCPAEPAIMCTSPDRRTLFVSFRSSGELASFRIDPATGLLTLLRVVPGGRDPAYLLPDHTGRFLLSAYYVDNRVAVHAIASDGSLSEAAVQMVPTAQNAHGMAVDSTNRLVFVTHTGANRIFQFRFDPEQGRLAAADPEFVAAAPGAHPRHIVLHPSDRWAYVNNEAADSLTVYAVNRAEAQLSPLQTVPTLPAGVDGAGNATARCEMTLDGRYVYVANRGHDSIAGFAIDQETGRVNPLGQTATEPTPRSFSITPSGRYLYAAGERSGRLAAYRRHDDGSLSPLRTYEVGREPWSVLAVDTLVPHAVPAD